MIYRENYILEDVKFLSSNKKETEKEESSWLDENMVVSNDDDVLPF